MDLPLGDLALAVPGLPRTFHGLPSFALPYKRFVTDVICDRSKTFLGSDQSYRQTVRRHGREIVYDDRQDEALARQAAALAHSTVWRWLTWLGDALQETLAHGATVDPRTDLRQRPAPRGVARVAV